VRVLIVTDWNRGSGGAEAYISWFRDGLREAGDEVRLLTSSAGSAADGTADYVAFGTETIAAQAFLQIHNPFAVRAIRKALREFSPDVVFVNMFAHHLSPAILEELKGRAVVMSVSDFKVICPIGSRLRPDATICTVKAGAVCRTSHCVSTAHWIRDLPRYARIRSGLRHVTRVVACSEWVRRELAASGIESSCIYLPVPAPSEAYERRPASTPHFLFCGRLDVEKGADLLLRAFAAVRSRHNNAVLRIAGRGPEQQRLQQIVVELGLDENVQQLGWLSPSDIERELSQAWALVAPSLWAEPLGLVALEAIVRGVPVIATASGGFAETVEEKISGALVPNGDVDRLAEQMILIANRESFPTLELDREVTDRIANRHSISLHVALMREVFTQTVQSRTQNYVKTTLNRI
jgi:glycosyltransferase involved in cell wall biosynthesis